MRVRILRQESPAAEPYWESFEYDGPESASVSAMLDYLNYHDDIVNDAGQKTRRITWECSCLQGVCGACAMVINNTPALACETFLRDLEGNEVVLRPLGKFPVIRDLAVDRTSVHRNLQRGNVSIGTYQPAAKESFAHQYDAAKCLKCGLCLEICPNYTNGESFFGAVFANDCYLVYLWRGVRKRLLPCLRTEPREDARHQEDLCAALRQRLFQVARLHGRLPDGDSHHRVHGQAQPVGP